MLQFGHEATSYLGGGGGEVGEAGEAVQKDGLDDTPVEQFSCEHRRFCLEFTPVTLKWTFMRL